jgi:hypothetical protein
MPDRSPGNELSPSEDFSQTSDYLAGHASGAPDGRLEGPRFLIYRQSTTEFRVDDAMALGSQEDPFLPRELSSLHNSVGHRASGPDGKSGVPTSFDSPTAKTEVNIETGNTDQPKSRM